MKTPEAGGIRDVSFGDEVDGILCAVREARVSPHQSALRVDLVVVLRNDSLARKRIALEYRGKANADGQGIWLEPHMMLDRYFEDHWSSEFGGLVYDGPSWVTVGPQEEIEIRFSLLDVPFAPPVRRWRVCVGGWKHGGDWIGPAYSPEWQAEIQQAKQANSGESK